MKKTYITFAISILLLSACSKNNNENEAEDKQSNEAFLKNITTVPAELSSQTQELTLAGKVECDPEKVMNYIPLVNGIVDRTFFSLGDRVQQGQKMLDIRSTELSALQAEKTTLESDEKIAERELKAAQSMYNDDMLSEKELMEAQGKLKQTQAALNKIKADMAVYGENKGNGSFSIKAPISGYVINKNISSGTTVSEGGEALFTIADLSTVWIIANVYAGNLQFVHEGMDVEITSLSYPGEIFYGKINSIPQVFDREEKVLKARHIMQNKDLKFKPEMSVMVKLKNEDPVKCVAIPSSTLIFDDNRYFVIVEESRGKFISKEVILQGHNGQTSYIASGLNEGDKIVTNNQLLIYAGIKRN